MKHIFVSMLIVMGILLLTACTSKPVTTPTLAFTQTAEATETIVPTSTKTPTLAPTLTPTLSVPDSVNFNIEDGTDATDIVAIKQGVSLAHFYLETVLGGDEAASWPNITVNVFNADSKVSCCQGLTRGKSGFYEPGPSFYTLHPNWVSRNPLFPGSIFLEHKKHSTHEYTHSWQSAIGCAGGKYGNPLGNWLTEGMAEYITWNALVQSGELTHKQVIKFHVDSALSQAGQPDFQSWENNENLFDWWAYNYAYLAVEKLVSDNGGPMILRRLCEETARIAPETNIRDYKNLSIAMQNLGIDKEIFYSELPAYFDQVFQLDKSVCLSQSDTRVKCLGKKEQDYIFSIPFAIQSHPDQWVIDSTCKLDGFGVSGSDNSSNLMLNVSRSVHGTCNVKIIFSTNQQVTVNFLAP